MNDRDFLTTVKAAVVDAIASEPMASGRAERLRILAAVLVLPVSEAIVETPAGRKQASLIDRRAVIAAITGVVR